jgi:hypothetical protein
LHKICKHALEEPLSEPLTTSKHGNVTIISNISSKNYRGKASILEGKNGYDGPLSISGFGCNT